MYPAWEMVTTMSSCLDEVLVLDLGVVVDDLRSALVGVLGPDLFELHDDHVVEELRAGEDGAVARDLVAQLAVLLGELLLLEPREAREAHLEDGFRLALGEKVLRALLRIFDLALGPPRARTNVSSPFSGSAMSARFAASGSALSRIVFDDEVHLGHRHRRGLR